MQLTSTDTTKITNSTAIDTQLVLTIITCACIQ